MRRKAEFLLVLGALLSLAACARTPSRVSREITAAGSRSDLVEATIEAIGYEGWPYETNTTFRERDQLDTLYDILRESQPEGQWDASDQVNSLDLTFRSGKVVSLQFGAEESVRALYGTPLMEFFRRVAVPTVLKNGWVPNEEVRAKVRDVTPDDVEKLTINGREFDGPLERTSDVNEGVDYGPMSVTDRADIQAILHALQTSVMRPGKPIQTMRHERGYMEIRLKSGAVASIDFSWRAVRYELGIHVHRLLRGLIPHHSALPKGHIDHAMQDKFDAIDEIGIDQFELEGPAFGLKKGERAVLTQQLSRPPELPFYWVHFVHATSSSPTRKVRPEECDSRATFIAKDGKDKVIVPMHSKTIREDWGEEMDNWLKQVRESDFGRTRGVPTPWEIWKNGKLVRPAGEDQKND